MIDEHDLAADEQQEDPFAGRRAAKPWMDDIRVYEKATSKYNDVCDKIDKLYASLEDKAAMHSEREFQIFWANLEVLKPSIYSRPPVPVVISRFRDRREINRHASEVLERTLITSFDLEDIDVTMRHVRDDLATNARGVVWLRYEADQQSERVTYDHVDRKDFAHEVARKWKEVGWVARRSWLTRKDGLARFGDEWLKATFTDKPDKSDDEQPATQMKAAVWEIWHKVKGVVVWVADGMEDVLDIQEPFLSLDQFFPCPRPAYGTLQRGSLIPVPDFVYYRDQVEEINEMTARISALAEALRMKGFYSAGVEELSDAIEAALKKTDNNALLIPVPNTAALGGAALKDSIVWLPVAEIAQVITQLIALRRQLIEDVYQITGLSDIMRGATNPNETLGAQQLKSQYGSVRVRDRQNELVRIARDVTRIAGEIISENFQPQTIMAMSQYEEAPKQQQVQQQIQGIRQQVQQKAQQVQQNPQLIQQLQSNPKLKQQAEQAVQQAQAQIKQLEGTVTIEQVLQFLQQERMRPFTLDIETDSTIQPDEQANQQAVTQFMGALATALAQLGPLVQAQPDAAPFAAEVLKFATAPFRSGRQLEGAIEEFADNMKQVAGQPKPNPELEKMKAEAEKYKADMALRKEDLAMRKDTEDRKLELEAQKIANARDADENAKAAEVNKELVKAGRSPDYAMTGNREQFNAISQMVQTVSENQASIAEGLGDLAQSLNAPKRVVRDEQGKAIGVETVAR